MPPLIDLLVHFDVTKTIMSQQRLNSLIIFNVHKGQTDSLNLIEVANELETRNID